MLTALIPPTTRNLMAPETVLSRLGLAESELPVLTLQVEEASALVCRYLGYECAYGTWEESFTFFPTGSGLPTSEIYLGARPAWSVFTVTQRASVLAASTYALRRGPYGESTIYRSLGWGGDTTWIGPAPDYTAQYTAGWWLEEMPIEDIPAGVQPFPPELRGDFLNVMRWYRSRSPLKSSVKRMREDGAEVEYFSGADQATDPITGIPMACLSALSLYRRAV